MVLLQKLFSEVHLLAIEFIITTHSDSDKKNRSFTF